MRWLFVKDLQLLRRSPLVTGLLVVYPIVLAVLIGLAISRSPEKPRVAFLNEIPAGNGLQLGSGGFSQDEARRQLCAKVDCVDVSSRAEAEQKVKDGDVLGALILPADFVSKLQGELSTNSSEPATVDVIVNNDDPLKAQVVDDRIRSLLTQANLLLSEKISNVAGNYEQILANGGSFEIPFINQTVHILGLRKAEQILNQVEAGLPPAQRARVAQVSDFARLARQNLALANSLLASVRQPIAVNKEVIAGSVPPLDTFAVAVAAAITLLFVTVLLASGSLALEREENTFTRLTRGLISRTGLLVEKVALGTGAALVVTLILLAAITPFESIAWSRIYLIVPAILFAGAASSGLGLAIGAAAREVRASALLAFALALPVAFISLVPSGTVSKGLLDVIHVIAGAFPFRATVDALSGALSASGPSLGLPLLHLAVLTIGYLILARLALRRFA
ncbi:MAG TPA: ABC transporter permease [Solirubrobacterales bacterium]|nr:ABC transporter permease [Solirubrobacterales bacterium]